MRFSILAMSCAALGLFAITSDSRAALKQSYVAGHYMVEVGGQSGGFVSQAAGGGVSSTMTVERGGAPGVYPKKRVGPPQYDDVVFTIGAPDRPVTDWIKAAVNSAQMSKRDGAIIAADQSFKEMSRVSWKGGYLSEVTFPELDASQNKKRWEIELTVTPDSTTTSIGAGAVVASGPAAKAKASLTSNFRMTIAGLNLQRVMRIGELSVRFRAVSNQKGDAREFEKTPGTVDVSNLVFELPEADGPQLYGWYQGFVKGGGADKDKKSATIELLSQDLKVVLCKLTLAGVGIMKVGPTAPMNQGDTVRRVRAEAFVESLQLELTSER
jgi:hypothetical protein